MISKNMIRFARWKHHLELERLIKYNQIFLLSYFSDRKISQSEEIVICLLCALAQLVILACSGLKKYCTANVIDLVTNVVRNVATDTLLLFWEKS